MHKKILLISILFFCSAFSRSTTFDDRTSCEESKGAWRQFGNSCADECEAKLDEFAFCTDLVISACECGKSRCWNDEVKSCAALSDYKKIFVARQKEEKKIADANTLIQKMETAKTQLDSDLTLRSESLANCESKNQAQHRYGMELLEKYQNKGCTSALLQKEPFTGLKQVQIENMLELYREKLDQQKLVLSPSAL